MVPTMGLGAPELIIILGILAFMVLPIWGIVDAAMRPDEVWSAAGQSKLVWVLIEIFLWTLGAALSFIAVRPKLKAVGGPQTRPAP
ncbi:MAG TPA: hypothetical protein VHL53_10815 [Acidimicrobiia bacterium]|nr:hypothetical protein [Acidimicrobiia bacterium]